MPWLIDLRTVTGIIVMTILTNKTNKIMKLGEIQDALTGRTLSYKETRDGEVLGSWEGKVVEVILDAVLVSRTMVLSVDFGTELSKRTMSVFDGKGVALSGDFTRKTDSGSEVVWKIKD